MKSIRYLCAFLLSLTVFAGTAMAQNATLEGRITDAQSGVVMNALITLTAAGQPSRTTRTSADGMFGFDNVRPGQYSLQIEAQGFATATQIVTVPGDAIPAPVHVTLQVARVNESIDVLASNAIALEVPSSTGSRLNLTPFEVPASIQIVSGDVIVREATYRSKKRNRASLESPICQLPVTAAARAWPADSVASHPS